MKEIKFEFGEKRACIFGDTVWVPMTPSELEMLKYMLRDVAKKSSSYSEQENYHRFSDMFDNAYYEWRIAREGHDKKCTGKE